MSGDFLPKLNVSEARGLLVRSFERDSLSEGWRGKESVCGVEILEPAAAKALVGVLKLAVEPHKTS
jgi:hypothetical protein